MTYIGAMKEVSMSIHKAMLEVQKELPPITKTRTVSFSGRNYKYVDIADILKVVVPILNKHKVYLSQSVRDGLLVTDFTSDMGESSLHSIPFIYPENITPQQMGSLLTYYRRYGLCAALGIAADEDDDGQHATSSRPLASIQHAKGSVSYGNGDEPPVQDFDEFMRATAPQEISKSNKGTPISEKQKKRLFALSKQSNWTDSEVKELILKATGQESSAAIPWTSYDEICNTIIGDPH